jgi:hypothetical protein
MYFSGAGGFAVTPDGTTGTISGEVGMRLAPNLFIFGNLGQFHNLQPSQLQPAIDDETMTLLNTGLAVTGTARAPAWYTSGGVRYNVPSGMFLPGVTPYVFGGLGLARMTPTAQFTYTSGTLAGATPSPGDDVTGQLISNGDFTQPASSNALMLSAGGGIDVPLAPRVAVEVGYRFSRIALDLPINAQSIVFGLVVGR